MYMEEEAPISQLNKIDRNNVDFLYTAMYLDKVRKCKTVSLYMNLIFTGASIWFGISALFFNYQEFNFIPQLITYGLVLIVFLIVQVVLSIIILDAESYLAAVNAPFKESYKRQEKRMWASIARMFIPSNDNSIVDEIVDAGLSTYESFQHFASLEYFILGVNTELFHKGDYDAEDKGKIYLKFLYASIVINIVVGILWFIFIIIFVKIAESGRGAVVFSSISFIMAAVGLFGAIGDLIYTSYLSKAVKYLKKDKE